MAPGTLPPVGFAGATGPGPPTVGARWVDASLRAMGGAEWGCGTASGVGSIPGATSPSAVDPDTIALPHWNPRPFTQVSSGSCAIHDPAPTTRQSRPTEMFRNALTTVGSNCAPEHRTSSCRAAMTPIGRRYGRTAVITSYESATATIRPAREIFSAASARGYPLPSQRSW